jgi:hypothetical protein
VNRLRRELLAAAAFTADEHRRVGGRHLADVLTQLAYGLAVAGHSQAVAGGRLQVFTPAQQRPAQSAGQHLVQPVKSQRLRVMVQQMVEHQLAPAGHVERLRRQHAHPQGVALAAQTLQTGLHSAELHG